MIFIKIRSVVHGVFTNRHAETSPCLSWLQTITRMLVVKERFLCFPSTSGMRFTFSPGDNDSAFEKQTRLFTWNAQMQMPHTHLQPHTDWNKTNWKGIFFLCLKKGKTFTIHLISIPALPCCHSSNNLWVGPHVENVLLCLSCFVYYGLKVRWDLFLWLLWLREPVSWCFCWFLIVVSPLRSCREASQIASARQGSFVTVL